MKPMLMHEMALRINQLLIMVTAYDMLCYEPKFKSGLGKLNHGQPL